MQDLIQDIKWMVGKTDQLQRDGSVYYLNGSGLLAVSLPGQFERVTIKEFVNNYLQFFNYVELEEIIRETKILEGMIRPTVDDILKTTNQEFRRQLIRRMGFDNFVNHAKPTRIARDGSSELLLIKLKGDENIMVVKVVCPSTGDTYLLRVPPTMKTCRQAIAWTFGLEPSQYRPIRET